MYLKEWPFESLIWEIKLCETKLLSYIISYAINQWYTSMVLFQQKSKYKGPQTKYLSL